MTTSSAVMWDQCLVLMNDRGGLVEIGVLRKLEARNSTSLSVQTPKTADMAMISLRIAEET
jgi:hypothetical protein